MWTNEISLEWISLLHKLHNMCLKMPSGALAVLKMQKLPALLQLHYKTKKQTEADCREKSRARYLPLGSLEFHCPEESFHLLGGLSTINQQSQVHNPHHFSQAWLSLALCASRPRTSHWEMKIHIGECPRIPNANLAASWQSSAMAHSRWWWMQQTR